MSGQMTKVFVADARRRWSEEEKRAIVEESKTSPVARVAKKHGVAASLLFRWRKIEGIRVRSPSPSASGERTFVRVALPAPTGAREAGSGRASIEIELANGRRIKADQSIDPTWLKRVVEALEGR